MLVFFSRPDYQRMLVVLELVRLRAHYSINLKPDKISTRLITPGIYQIEVFKILNGYENIDSNIFFSKLGKVK